MSVQEDLASRRAELENAGLKIFFDIIRIAFLFQDIEDEATKEFYEKQTDILVQKYAIISKKYYEIILLQTFTYTLVSEKYEVRPNTIEMAGAMTELPNIEFQLFKEDGTEETDIIQYARICNQSVTFEHDGESYKITNIEGEFEIPTSDEEIILSETGDRDGDSIICPNCEAKISKDEITHGTLFPCKNCKKNLIWVTADDFPECKTEGPGGLTKHGIKEIDRYKISLTGWCYDNKIWLNQQDYHIRENVEITASDDKKWGYTGIYIDNPSHSDVLVGVYNQYFHQVVDMYYEIKKYMDKPIKFRRFGDVTVRNNSEYNPRRYNRLSFDGFVFCCY